jgi:diguanylate cyclase (GGDEF)-like protein/PAS domain S-box-containing protein
MVVDTLHTDRTSGEQTLRAEITRLNKVVNALMDRAERSTSAEGSDFSMFETGIMLEEQVRCRTEELEVAFRENEKIYCALEASESRFRGLVNQSLVGISIIEDGRCTYANPKLAEMFGYSVEGIQRLSIRDVIIEKNIPRVMEKLQQCFRGEMDRPSFHFQGLRKDGTVIELESHSSVMELSGKSVLISMTIDITERIRVERKIFALQEKLREQAMRDPLTGLYNRLPLSEFFDRELRIAERNGWPISTVMADMDHFKAINDSYGHQTGDEALKVFSGLIQEFYRASDIPCRYGGDEFLILLPNMTIELACERTERLRIALETMPIVYGTSRLHLTSSFGVAVFPEHGQAQDALVAAADRALYEAKKCGCNQVKCYSSAMAKQK